jgi:signal recognition particle receptor subunit beta
MGIEEKPLPAGPSIRLSVPPETVRNRAGVGAALEEVRSRLSSAAARLDPHLDPHARPLVTQARKVLAEQTCRVAVIGQIKAGKSSFINALTQRSDLLPTDVNPWTAVVTSLHFRNDRPPPEHAAVFHMFTREEWQRLAEGGGRLRELTERLVPGFEPELLRAQLEMMRQRVERRLGKRLDGLLGQSHGYQAVSAELLDRYVSAGTYLEHEDPGDQPNLSDVTRAAELFLTGGPFAFPVTLVDTPGTNDPFLVRDEITRRCLENADVFLFVISALQPLSASDIALLRILSGLHKDRIIVFINRIDQLRNPVGEAAQIRASVKARIDREFPALDVEVIAGSAWWGGLGLVAGGRDVYRLLPPSSLAYLKECGLPDPGTEAPTGAAASEHRAALARALHAASGLPAVAAAMNGLMSKGSAAVMLRQLASCFLELARSTEVSARMEVQTSSGLADARREQTRAAAERIRQERAALASLDAPIAQIQQSFAMIERQLADILATDIGRLRTDLSGIVERSAADECAQMMVAIRRREHQGEWSANLAPLRAHIETHFVNAYRATEARIIEIERVLYPQLRTIVDAIVPGSGIEVRSDWGQQTTPYPSVAPLSEQVVLDLGVPWWKMWFAARPDPAARAGQLRQLILDDFLPLTEELARQAHTELGGRIARTLQQAHVVSSGMLTAVQARKAQVITDYDRLIQHQASGGGDEADPRMEAQLAQARERHRAATTLVDELGKLVAFCQATLDRGVRT